MDEELETESSQSTVLSHRPDIDGLRGIAVLAVLGYHYFGGLFSGGYIGVDVFFVISGYLLSTIIISEVQAGLFSFSGFYERRIRRIFPALFALLAISSAFAWFFFLPPDIVSFSRSMLATSLSVSNFHFWRTSNYFDAPSAVRPLLHTWSLGVEEQFYIVLPIFIFVLHRYLTKNLRKIVVVVAIASFIWSAVEVRVAPGTAFFLPFTRAWELLFGTILALRIIPAPRSQVWRELISACGILGILTPLVSLTVNTPFPGENALLPCGAAAAIILAGESGSTLTSRFLSQRPMAFIGLISYSLYLWHWPILVFSRIAVFKKFDVPATIGSHFVLAILSIAIATLSWRFIETPFRSGPRRPTKRTIFAFGGACVSTFVVSALILLSTRGITGRFSPSANAIADYLDYGKSHPDELKAILGARSCFLDRRESLAHFNEAECLKPVPGKRQILIFGDSHAANLQYGLESSINDLNFLQATSSSCPPTLKQNRNSTAECRQFVNKILNDYIPEKSITMVLLIANWNSADLMNLTETVDLLHKRGVAVVIFGPFPGYDSDLPRLLAKAISNGEPDYVRKHLDPKQQILDAQMSQMARDSWRVPYLSPLKILCPDGICLEYAAQDVPLEFDKSHLTLQGSEYLGHEISVEFPGIFDSK
jgi:peptidoglycan/LPS O-acetylase OafA/YrhL